MASSALSVPGTVTSDSTVGTAAWTATGASLVADLAASDNSWALSALNNTTSRYLRASNWGFTIPTNAVITGIAVAVEKSRTTAGAPNVVDSRVHLVRRGVIMSSADNKATTTAWTGSDATTTYGSDGDMWGIPWVAEDINAWDFGFVISAVETLGVAATARVDLVTITVYYTAGTLASPQIQAPGEVILFGQRYPLMPETDNAGRTIGPGKVRTSLASQPLQRIITNQDYGATSDPVISSYTISDLTGGMGLRRYQDTVKQINRTLKTDRVTTLWDGLIVPEYKGNTAITAPGGETSSPSGVVAYGNTMVVLFAGKLYNYTGAGWSALIDTLPATPVSQPEVFRYYDNSSYQNRVFYALGASGYSYQNTVSVAATDVTTPLAQDFISWDSKVWALDTSFQLHRSFSGDSGSWTALARIPVEAAVDRPYGRLEVFQDAAGNAVIWCLTHYGPYLYDAENDTWIRSAFQHPYHRPSVANPYNVAIVHRSSLYVQIGDQLIVKLTMGTELLVEDVSIGTPSTPYTPIDSTAQFKLRGFMTDGRLLLAAVDGAATQARLLAFNDVGWHLLTTWGPLTGTTFPSFCYFNNTLGTGSWLNFYYTIAGVGTPNPAYLAQVDYTLAPDAAGSVFQSLGSSDPGVLELPIYDADYEALSKTARNYLLKLRNTSATRTVLPKYRINNSTGSYTALGSALAVNEEVTIPFGTAREGLAFKAIQFRFEFTSDSDGAAPWMEYGTLEFIRNWKVIRSYAVNIDLRNPAFGKTPQQMLDAIYAHLRSDLFGTFAWRDDAGNSRSVLVKVMKPDLTEETGYDFSSSCQLILLEQAAN